MWGTHDKPLFKPTGVGFPEKLMSEDVQWSTRNTVGHGHIDTYKCFQYKSGSKSLELNDSCHALES